MKAPDTLLYTKDHEWVRREGQAVAIGPPPVPVDSISRL